MNHLLLPAILGACASMVAQEVQPSRGLLERRYREGETLVYRMKGDNDGWRYEARASGVVRKDASGAFTEEYAWSDFVNNGAPFSLSAASVAFRQPLSLDPRVVPSVPNLAPVQPALIGPITDMLTFYADLWLAGKITTLSKAGDHAYVARATPNSWADGNHVTLGEDSIDFDLTVTKVDAAAKVGTLVVRHVAPKKPQVKLPAEWMQKPVADTPNNWVEVRRDGAKYVAAVGKETFDVQLTFSLVDGKILSGTLENPVDSQERDCQDAALTKCGEPRAHRILRRIEISLVQ